MNTHTRSIVGLGKSGLMAIAILTAGTITTSSAQDNIPAVPTPTFNGLFSPTAADRFFETGRNNFEREIDFVNDSEDRFSDDLLQLDPELVQQMKENPSTQNTWQSDRRAQFELFSPLLALSPFIIAISLKL